MINKERKLAFEAMVLQALWSIIWLLAHGKKPYFASDLRINMLMYLDYHGVQGDKAKELRREKFPEAK